MIATKVHGRMRPGPNGAGLSRKAILPRDRRQPAPARHRLRRPLPDPPLGSAHADRGDAGGAARRRAGRQGALHRRLVDVRVAVRQGAARRRTPRLDALRVDAELRQPALPRGGARDAAAVPRRRHRRDPVEPAGARPPDPRLGRDQRARGDRRVRAHAVREHRRRGPQGGRGGGAGGGGARRAAGTGGAGLGAAASAK